MLRKRSTIADMKGQESKLGKQVLVIEKERERERERGGVRKKERDIEAATSVVSFCYISNKGRPGGCFDDRMLGMAGQSRGRIFIVEIRI